MPTCTFGVNQASQLPCIMNKMNKISYQPKGRDSLVGCVSAWYADSRGFYPHVRQYSFVEIGHEIISTAILSLPLIQEGHMSVTGERMFTKYW